MKDMNPKQKARAALKGKWPEAIGVVTVGLICLLLESMLMSFLQYVFFAELTQLATFVTVVVAAVDICVFSPLYLGIIRWFWQVTGGQDEPVSSLFVYYQNAPKYFLTIKLRLSLWWRVLVVAIISLLPASFAFVTAESLLSIGQEYAYAYSVINTVAIVLLVIGIFAILIYFLRFFLVPAIIFSDENITVTDAFRLSNALTKGKRAAAFFSLIFSFLGPILLSVFILPIVYTLPFYLAAFLIYSREKINDFVEKNSQKAPENSTEN